MRSRVAIAENLVVAGHVVDLDDLDSRLVVELWVEGWPFRLTRAQQFDADLRDEGVGDGCYGFLFILDEELGKSGALVEARLANTGERLGEPLRLRPGQNANRPFAETLWLGGLRISGWIGVSSGATPTVRALVDGETVAEARADHWTCLTDGDSATPARAFDLDLPASFADGRARRVRVVDENDRDLPGSPVAVLAFEDGLEHYLAERGELATERARGAIFDALFSRAHPMRDYRNWALRFPATVPKLSRRPRAAVALIGDDKSVGSLESLDAQLGCDWVAAVLAGPDAASFASSDLGAFLSDDAHESDFVVFASTGVAFAPTALASYAEAFADQPQAQIVYGDMTVLSESGEDWPLAFTAFDYERMLEQGYVAVCFAARRALVESAVEAGVSDLFSVVLSAVSGESRPSFEKIAHTPRFLCRATQMNLDIFGDALRRAVESHLAARKVAASFDVMFAGRFPAIRISRKSPSGRVSVVVTTRDSLQALDSCLEAFRNTTAEVATDLLVVDLDSADQAARDGLAAMESPSLRVARISGPALPERAYNAAANVATGEFLFFCDDDMRPLKSGWLTEMLGRLSEPHVGAVTPTLLWSTGIIQQCGLVVGPNFSASRAFGDLADGDLGYAEMLATAHEVGAASSAGLLVRRSDFRNFGGFDVQRFGVNWACVDFSLRLRAGGFRIVATPFAKLMRSRLGRWREDVFDSGDRARRELENLRIVWCETLADDACYSPLLSTSGAPFSSLAWPPRPGDSRISGPPRPRPWPEGI
jgi:hypothetical protein